MVCLPRWQKVSQNTVPAKPWFQGPKQPGTHGNNVLNLVTGLTPTSSLLPVESIRRKKALVIMQLPNRYSENARLARVARILGNQINSMKEYLNQPNRHSHDWTPKWHLISQYNLQVECT